MRQSHRSILIFLCGALIGTAGFFVYNTIFAAQAAAVRPVTNAIREKDAKYSFINPLLLCSVAEIKPSDGYKQLENIISTIRNKKITDHEITDASIYFRNLNTGRWTGVNENENYSPASLLKVPTMIAFFKLAETDTKLLDKKVLLSGNINENATENFRSTHELLPNRQYSVLELINAMIIASDNNARRMLHENIDANWIKEVYTDLGLSIPTAENSVDFMSAKKYSYFFRVLYNGSYLTREFSDHALQILSKTDYVNGIVAGLPQSITVAHKFGEREIVNDDSSPGFKELHDCGIVYTANPYLLCIMTKGSNYGDLANTIKEISAAVYSEVAK